MKNYLNKNYSHQAHLAPDNPVGRLGATIFQHTDDGMGVYIPGTFLTVIMGAVAGGILSEGAVMAAAIVGFFPLIFLTLIFSTLYASRKAVRVPGGDSYYAHETQTHAYKIAKASEDYRALPKKEREPYREVIYRMNQNVKNRDFESAFYRAQKFNDAYVVMTARNTRSFDTNDVEALESVVREYRKMNKEIA